MRTARLSPEDIASWADLLPAGMPRVSDGRIVLTRFTPADAAVMCAADDDPEMRRRFDCPADFVPSIDHTLHVIDRWAREWAAGDRFPCAVAFDGGAFERLEIVTDPDNIASRRIALGNGFEEVGLRDGQVLHVRDRHRLAGSTAIPPY